MGRRSPEGWEAGSELPRLKRKIQPDNLDEQVKALKRFQSLPGFIAGIRAARKRSHGSVLSRLAGKAGRGASRVMAAVKDTISRIGRSLIGKQTPSDLQPRSSSTKSKRRQ